jgi:hypothetical protein
VEQQDTGPVPALIAALEAGLQHVHRQTVDVVHEAGAYAGRQSGMVKSANRGYLHLLQPANLEQSIKRAIIATMHAISRSERQQMRHPASEPRDF